MNSGQSLTVKGRSKKRDFNRKEKSRSKSQNQKGKYFICQKPGHYQRECPDRKQQPNKGKNQGEVAVAQDNYDNAEALCAIEVSNAKDWILDSGCSFHVTPTKAWFESFVSVDNGHVLLGNNKACKVMGSGTIRLKMFDGTERVLKEVRYVPELKRNLISLGVLDQEGYSFKVENGKLVVARG